MNGASKVNVNFRNKLADLLIFTAKNETANDQNPDISRN